MKQIKKIAHMFVMALALIVISYCNASDTGTSRKFTKQSIKSALKRSMSSPSGQKVVQKAKSVAGKFRRSSGQNESSANANTQAATSTPAPSSSDAQQQPAQLPEAMPEQTAPAENVIATNQQTASPIEIATSDIAVENKSKMQDPFEDEETQKELVKFLTTAKEYRGKKDLQKGFLNRFSELTEERKTEILNRVKQAEETAATTQTK